MKQLPMIMSCGLYYEAKGLRELCHAVKQHDEDAMTVAAECLSDIVTLYHLDGFHIIPIPNHSGKAEYTLEILKRLQKFSDIKIDDVLVGSPHETMYDAKKAGKPLSKSTFDFRLTKSITSRDTILFDNVIGSGTTYFAALDAIGIELPLLVLGQTHETEYYEREWHKWFKNEMQDTKFAF